MSEPPSRKYFEIRLGRSVIKLKRVGAVGGRDGENLLGLLLDRMTRPLLVSAEDCDETEESDGSDEEEDPLARLADPKTPYPLPV